MLNVLEIMQTDDRHKKTPADPAYGEGAAFVIDRYVPIELAAVPITDCGFLRSDACYDVASVSRGNFFRLEHHLDRFFRSMTIFALSSPFERSKIRNILIELARLSGFRDSYIWWAVTRGDTPHGVRDRLDPAKYENRFYAFAIPYVAINDDEQRQRGQDLIISEDYIRIPRNSVEPTAKNFHWLDLMMSLFEAGKKGAEWSLLLGINGYLTEGPGVNAFVVKNGMVLTPLSGCLNGVTRQTVLDLCAMENIPCSETNITKSMVLDADEIFITSTAGGIMPGGTINGKPIGNRKGPGPITARLHDLYWNKRWEGWDATPVPYAG